MIYFLPRLVPHLCPLVSHWFVDSTISCISSSAICLLHPRQTSCSFLERSQKLSIALSLSMFLCKIFVPVNIFQATYHTVGSSCAFFSDTLAEKLRLEYTPNLMCVYLEARTIECSGTSSKGRVHKNVNMVMSTW